MSAHFLTNATPPVTWFAPLLGALPGRVAV
jgi:hypothetical protein